MRNPSSTSDVNLQDVSAYTEDAQADLITELPGLVKPFLQKQFSGYLEIDKESGRNVFYWFVEAETNPENAPVLFWTNGGPGCSGLIAMLTEHGPFRVTKDGSNLKENPFAWTKEANVFYVEQPAGVGFSYSEDESFYDNIGDDLAAEDNYKIIIKFFEKFPQFKSNAFYLSSESYGGHYMPMLAKLVVDKQAELDPEERLQLKGFLVGNPFNNPDENMIGMVAAFWGQQLVPKPMVDEWYRECEVETRVCPLWATECKNGSRHPSEEQMAKCLLLEAKMKTTAGDLNMYGLDWPVCEEPQGGSMQRYTMLESLAASRGHKSLRSKQEPFVPCEENWSTRFLNRDDVREALHVRAVKDKPKKWIECSNRHNGSNPFGTIEYDMNDHKTDMSSYYKYLIDGGHNLKILIYSGDADSVCATAGTQTWMYDLGYPVVKDWTSWSIKEQVAGYVTKFQGFTFLTVHKSGHEVPMYQPEAGLELLRGYLAGDF